MKRVHRPVLALSLGCALFLMSGCFGSSEENPDSSPAASSPHNEVAPVEPAPVLTSAPSDSSSQRPWKYRYVAKCEGTPAEKCVGAYGFSISSDGIYEIGPGPQGQLLSGDLDRADLRQLGDLVSTASLEGCAAAWNAKPCPGVEEELKRLAAKYHPESFPNPCVDAAFDLELAYANVTHCQTDSDCAYLDDQYLPISPDRPRDVTTDDCSYVKPLFTANAFEAVAQQLPLVLKRELVRRVCRDARHRPTCSRPDTPDPLRHPPRCVQRSCRPGFDLAVF